MSIKIIADSCCDTTPELREQLDIDLVPLHITIPGYSDIADTVDIDTDDLIVKMNSTKEPARTACPSVHDYASRMRKEEECIVITISKLLSGSYNAARLAREMVLKESPEKKIHIFDSQSAASGELLIAMFVNKLKKLGETYESIIERTESLIKKFRTLFVLEDLGNLVKNGRMSRVKGIVASVFSMHPVLGDNGMGEIESLHIVRGLNQAFTKLVSTVRDLTSSFAPKSTPLVVSHCHNSPRAEMLKEEFLEACPAISDVTIVPTSGLSTIYASKGGIVIAFGA